MQNWKTKILLLNILLSIISINVDCADPDPIARGDKYYQKNKLTNALQAYYQALQTSPDSLRVLHRIKKVLRKQKALEFYDKGCVAYQNVDFNSAQIHWLECSIIFREINDSLNLGKTLQYQGLAAYSLNKYADAIDYFEQVLAIYPQAEHAEFSAGVWSNLGLVYQAQYLFDQALECHTRSFEMNTAMKNDEKQAANYENLGTLFYQSGDYIKSIDYLKKALKLENDLNLESEKAQTLEHLGLVWLALGDTNLYLRNVKKAISIFEKHRLASELDLAISLNNLSQVQRLLKQYAKSESLSIKAIQLFRKANHCNGQASVLCNLGAIRQAEHNSEMAIEYYQNGLRLAEAAKNLRTQWICHFNIGQVYDLNKKPSPAIKHYRCAISLIEGMNRSIQSPIMKFFFSTNKREVYEAAFFHLIKAGKIHAALEIVEQQKSQILFDKPKAGRNTNSPGVVNHSFDEFLAEIQAKIPDSSAILDYYLMPHHSYIFCITRSNTTLIKVEGIEKKIQADWMAFFRGKAVDSNCSGTQDSVSWKAIMISFYKLLIGSVEVSADLQNINRLIIIPDGLLYYVPFAALIDSGGKFLIETRTISYSYCLKHLLNSNSRPANVPLRIALFGNPTDDTPGMLDEIDQISKLYPENARVFTNRMATETALHKVAADVDILHIASHGCLYDSEPSESHLKLRSDAENDGRLDLNEIFNLQLNSKLVTLSACNSALGARLNQSLPEGSNVIGLSTAFISAGAQNVVAGLWNINDRASAQLMVRFYNHLKNNTLPDALALAQRDMLTSKQFHQPYFWAGFILVGSPF